VVQMQPKGVAPQSAYDAAQTRYWTGHSTIALARPVIQALKILAEPGDRIEDTVRRLVDRAVTKDKEPA
jgi:hypothetical protein